MSRMHSGMCKCSRVGAPHQVIQMQSSFLYPMINQVILFVSMEHKSMEMSPEPVDYEIEGDNSFETEGIIKNHENSLHKY